MGVHRMSNDIQRWAVVLGGIGGMVTNHAEATAEVAAEREGWIPAGASRIGDIWQGGDVFSAPSAPAVPLADLQAAAVERIDADVDAIYDKVMGRRQAEYERTEIEAREYAEAGYTGTVPPMVQSWATAKAWTAQAAADDILAVSSAWRTAQEVLRAQRLLRKEQARAALGPAALNAVLATWAGFVMAIRGQLGLGGV